MSEGPSTNQHLPPGLDIGQSLWQSCVDQLAQELPEQQFNTWIKPLTALVQEDFSKVTIFVANRFKLDWVRAQYSTRIAALLEKMYGQPVLVELAITPRETVARQSFAPQAQEMVVTEESVPTGETTASGLPKNRLNSALTFENLVEGTANRMARAAAMHCHPRTWTSLLHLSPRVLAWEIAAFETLVVYIESAAASIPPAKPFQVTSTARFVHIDLLLSPRVLASEIAAFEALVVYIESAAAFILPAKPLQVISTT